MSQPLTELEIGINVLILLTGIAHLVLCRKEATRETREMEEKDEVLPPEDENEPSVS